MTKKIMKIKSERELMKSLVRDIKTCGKGKIVFQAGHFPNLL